MEQETQKSVTPDQLQKCVKRQRGGAKAAVTRLMTQITTAMNCNQPKDVEIKLAALDEAVVRFHEIHDIYHKSLEDDDDLDASKGYLTSVLRDVQDLQHIVLNWLEDFKPSMESFDASNFQEEQKTLDKSIKPQMSLVDQLSTQFQELQSNKESSVLLAQQEERLRAEFKLQLQQAELEMDGLKGLLKLKDAEIEENRQKAELTSRIKDFSTPISVNPSLSFRPSFSAVNENSLCQLLELSRQQYQSHVDSMHLPPVDIIKFDGEPLKSWQFIRLFSSVIDKETVPDQEKLTRLH